MAGQKNGIKAAGENMLKGLAAKVRLFFAQEFFRSRIAIWLLASSIFFNLADWLALYFFIQPADYPIILHYNVYFGVDVTGDWRRVYVMPAIGLFLFLVNFFLSIYFYRLKERIASYLLLMAALMVQLSLAVAILSVIVINY